jgi:6-phosphogluconolactonase (cycloisomerase 2 family)
MEFCPLYAPHGIKESNIMFYRRLILLVSLLFDVALFAQSRFVYTNDDSFFAPNTVSVMAIQNDGSLTQVGLFPTGGGGNAGNGFGAARRIIVSPDNRYIFASNGASNDVSAFTIDPATGKLSLVPGSPFNTGGNGCDGISLAASPDMRFLFTANICSSDVSIFKIGSDGSLQLLGGPTPMAGFPIDLKVTNNGHFLMVSLGSFSGGLVGVFSIGDDGSLTPVAGSPFFDSSPPGAFTTSLDTNCSSDRLFLLSASGLPAIDVFNIDASGSLTQIPNSPFPAPGNGVTGIYLSPDEKFLFASNQQNSTTSFNIAPDGSLSVVDGTPVAATGTAFLSGLATDSTGHFLYVAGFIKSLAAYTVTANGGLTLQSGSPFQIPGVGGLESLATYPTRSCPGQAITVSIEVEPGNPSPVVNSKAQGTIPVAILASPTFNPVTQVNTGSLRFGHSGTENSLAFCNSNGADLNGDGLPDLLCHFNTASSGFQIDDTQATLTGTTLTGTPISGTATITVIH